MEQNPEQHEQIADEVQRRGGLVLRTLPIIMIPLFVSILTFLLVHLSGYAPPPRPDRVRPPGFIFPLVPIVVLVVFFSALIVLVRLRRPTLSALILIGAWTLVTTFTALQSGVTTTFPALMIIPICVAGLLIDGAASISLAALASLLVASLAWLQISGFTTPRPPPQSLEPILPLLSAGFWIGIFCTVAALTWLLAGGLQRALVQSRRHAEALQDLSSQLEGRVAQQTAQLVTQAQEAATLEERARLAREIHDTLAQGLTGIVVQLGAAQRALTAAPSEAPQHLDLAQRMAREALAEARRSVWNLRPQVLERGDLASALTGLAARPLASGTVVRFDQRGEPWPLPPDVESALLRVAQEGLANVGKHAGADHADLVLEYAPNGVQLLIHDDGVGFESAMLDVARPVPGPQGGFGLLGMRERIEAMGGSLELINDEGALVRASIPRGTAGKGHGAAGNGAVAKHAIEEKV